MKIMQDANLENEAFMDDLLEVFRLRLLHLLSKPGDERADIKKQLLEAEQRVDLNDFTRLRVLEQLLGLNELERDIILFCLVQELAPELGPLYAGIQEDPLSPFATPRFFMSVLGKTAAIRLEIAQICSGSGALFLNRLLRFSDHADPYQVNPGARPLALDARILQYLCGSSRLDDETYGALLPAEPRELESLDALVADDELRGRIENLIDDPSEEILVLRGDPGAGLADVASAIAQGRGRGLLRLRLSGGEERRLRDILFRSMREAMLWNMELLVEEPETLRRENGAVARNLLIEQARFSVPLIIAVRSKDEGRIVSELLKDYHELEIPLPGTPARKQIWTDALSRESLENNILSPEELARRFKFSGGRIRAAVAFARRRAWTEHGPESPITRRNLLEGCRSQSNRRLGDVAGKVETRFGWDDIVLPGEQKAKLKEACAQVQYMEDVFGEWGFEDVIAAGRGLNMLFSGPSGTGKTMAAGIIAAELGLEMYKVDLSTVISKYIGETEKNLSRVFAEAETANAVLFFDEADAMFGKRSEVQSAHDRFANIEVGYLLQRMEEYTGIVVLATNLSENIDDAFLRRLQFMIEFPMPGPAERLAIWKKAFPEKVRIAPDVDFEFLARRLQLSGANIKNIVLQAAFHAVENSSEITMRHVVLGIRHEMQKESKPLLRADLGDYYDYLESDVVERKPAPSRGKGTRKAGLA